jgi:hypothetical protein
MTASPRPMGRNAHRSVSAIMVGSHICYERAAYITISLDGTTMAELIPKQMAARQEELSEACSPAGATEIEAFATNSNIMLKHILHLQEALAFYELHCFHAVRAFADAPSPWCQILDLPAEAASPSGARQELKPVHFSPKGPGCPETVVPPASLPIRDHDGDAAE